MVDKLEVIYYELIKMEDRVTQKAEAVLKAREDIEKFLNRFEILQKELLKKLEECKNENRFF